MTMSTVSDYLRGVSATKLAELDKLVGATLKSPVRYASTVRRQ